MQVGTIVRTPLGLGRVVGFTVHHEHGKLIVVKVGGGMGVHGFEPFEVEVRESWLNPR